jgi:CBS domain
MWLETFSTAEQLMADFVKTHGRKAKDVMTRQVISVDPDRSLQEIANLLEKHGIKRVPVIENGRLVGIVSRANLVQALATRGLAFVDVAEADEALRKVIVLNLRKLPLTAAMTMVDVIVDGGVVNLWAVVRNEEENCVERPGQIHGQYIIPYLLRDFGKAGGLLDARIINENVCASPRRNLIHHGGNGGRLTHICIEKASIGSSRLAHCSNSSVCLLTSRKAVHRETSAGRGKSLTDGEANALDGAGHQRCPTLKKAFLHENHYSITSSARASRVVGALRPMPLPGGRPILEDQVEQEMHVAAVGSAFRRLGSIGSPHLAQVPYVRSDIRFRAASI